MKRGWIVIVLLILVNVTSYAEDNADLWTLARCQQSAIANSNRLMVSSLAIERANADLREALAEQKGSFEFSATATHISEVMEMELNLPLPPGTPSPTIKFGDGNSIDMQTAVRVPLYTGGALTARGNAMRYGVKSAERQAVVDTLDVKLQVETAYWMTVGAMAKVNALRQSLQRLERHKSEIDTLIILGAATHEMLPVVESKILQVNGTLSTAYAEVETAKLNLGMIVGKSGELITPETSFESTIKNDSVNDPFTQSRPELLTIDARISQAEAASGIAKASYLPSLGFVFAYHYAKPGINAVANDWMGYYNTGLNVSWTIWDWKARHNRSARADIIERELALRKSEIEDALLTREKSSNRRYTAAIEVEEFATNRVMKEKERLSLLRARYKLGAATESELLDVEDDLTSAETELIEAKVKCQITKAEFQRATSH